MFGVQLVNLLVQCCGVFLSEYTIVYEDDRVDKIRGDSTWQHVHIQTCCMWDQGLRLIYLFILSLIKAVLLYIAAMFDDRTS